MAGFYETNLLHKCDLNATVEFYLRRSFCALCKWRNPLIAIYDIEIEDLNNSYLIQSNNGNVFLEFWVVD